MAPKVLESCSNFQKTWQVIKSAIKKIFLLLGFSFFVSDVISGPLHLTLDPNH